jgi:hypothetical protein
MARAGRWTCCNWTPRPGSEAIARCATFARVARQGVGASLLAMLLAFRAMEKTKGIASELAPTGEGRGGQ